MPPRRPGRPSSTRRRSPPGRRRRPARRRDQNVCRRTRGPAGRTRLAGTPANRASTRPRPAAWSRRRAAWARQRRPRAAEERRSSTGRRGCGGPAARGRGLGQRRPVCQGGGSAEGNSAAPRHGSSLTPGGAGRGARGPPADRERRPSVSGPAPPAVPAPARGRPAGTRGCGSWGGAGHDASWGMTHCVGAAAAHAGAERVRHRPQPGDCKGSPRWGNPHTER